MLRANGELPSGDVTDVSPAAQAHDDLRRILQEVEKGRCKPSEAVRRGTQGPPTGAAEHPRLIPVHGKFPTNLDCPAPFTIPNADDTNAWYNLRIMVTQLIRDLPLDRSAGVDGVPNSMIASLLRLKRFGGADMLVRTFQALDSDAFQTDDAHACARACMTRSKGAAFEKPNKPSKFRGLWPCTAGSPPKETRK